MKAMVVGCSGSGSRPALEKTKPGSCSAVPIASAIRLRHALCSSTKSTWKTSEPGCLAISPVHM